MLGEMLILTRGVLTCLIGTYDRLPIWWTGECFTLPDTRKFSCAIVVGIFVVPQIEISLLLVTNFRVHEHTIYPTETYIGNSSTCWAVDVGYNGKVNKTISTVRTLWRFSIYSSSACDILFESSAVYNRGRICWYGCKGRFYDTS